MTTSILVVAEHRDGSIKQVTYEAIEAARQSSLDETPIHLALIGHELHDITEQLSSSGVTTIYSVDHEDCKHYNPEIYAKVLTQIIEQSGAEGIIFGHTTIGRDLSPIISANLDAGQISDVTAIEQTADQVLYTRPIYAGKAFEQKTFRSTPWVLTIRPNNIPAAETSENTATHVEIEYKQPDSLRTVIKNVVQKSTGKIDLAEAKVVIAGGRGVKSSDGFKPLEELAQVLGGAVGASRGACDAEYCDYALQIGQTGKVVTPEIYIACGISGAIQHVAGMSQSRLIIAINKDPEAPIFKLADYGIVGDLFEVVPLLTEEFKSVLSSSKV
ncbi:electron transfer flavoprotein subunit alpha/FixB family protein [Alkalicoccobacillus plakortidis]|uniref:Electron transfer flavoprotein subunit alpha/FixB family protein n=1 Tax=Alkalicoccobacillus plakortidis TaxID=444060 RepID=A0ABT0XQI8_9BACI|nr:electron transfer flavoprotein subunit alpha/FixB family protein [Alkalicoccobacillus plakortidis]MCM2677547.1 electron transfer flavoprotein subunit alpha/FixB family protein [Alkalicoccobacillus plakortidis]